MISAMFVRLLVIGLLGFVSLLKPSSLTYTYTTIGAQLFGINDVGQIVGSYGGYTGFEYDQGAFHSVPPIPRDINNVGQIVGALSPSGGGYLYFDGMLTLLNNTLSANGINNLGQIVGNADNGAGSFTGFLYSNGTYSPINVPGSSYTQAYDINDLGDIVGFFTYAGEITTQYIHSFVYRNGLYSVFDVPDAVQTYPYGTIVTGINNAGDMVGFYESPSGRGSFAYSGGVFSTIAVPGAFESTTAFHINNAGQVVGQYSADGSSRGFLATPVPEPVSFLLVAGGVVLAAALISFGRSCHHLIPLVSRRLICCATAASILTSASCRASAGASTQSSSAKTATPASLPTSTTKPLRDSVRARSNPPRLLGPVPIDAQKHIAEAAYIAPRPRSSRPAAS